MALTNAQQDIEIAKLKARFTKLNTLLRQAWPAWPGV